jgi:hypothetical protein
MNVAEATICQVGTTAGVRPGLYIDHNRAMDLLFNDPTSLLVLGRRLAPRRLEVLQQLPVPRPRGKLVGRAAAVPAAWA